MPWCPVCKNEYNEGVKVCADCGAALVDSIKERKEILLCKGEDALIARMQKFLEYNDIPVVFETGDEEACLYVLPKYEQKAKQAAHVFLVESAAEAENTLQADGTDSEEGNAGGSCGKESMDELPEDEDEEDDLRMPRSVYRKKSERADDLKSSGEVLLIFGILGCIALLLIDFGILPIRFGNRIMMNVIMFALFFFFIGFGIYSLRGARRFRTEASDEDALTERIEAWVKEHLTAEEIDKAAELEESDADEICFFKRAEAIRKKIADEFDGVDESYLDSLAENVYQELFE